MIDRVIEVFDRTGDVCRTVEVGDVPEPDRPLLRAAVTRLRGDLDLLAARLDLAGAGDLLEAITQVCWSPHDSVCPRCGWRVKQDPQPHPRPPQPPPPPPPPPPDKGK